jgi:hypothetical protein
MANDIIASLFIFTISLSEALALRDAPVEPHGRLILRSFLRPRQALGATQLVFRHKKTSPGCGLYGARSAPLRERRCKKHSHRPLRLRSSPRTIATSQVGCCNNRIPGPRLTGRRDTVPVSWPWLRAQHIGNGRDIVGGVAKRAGLSEMKRRLLWTWTWAFKGSHLAAIRSRRDSWLTN